MSKLSPRSLVGTSQRRRKELAWTEWCAMGMRAWPAHAAKYRVGQRLRPCIVCDGTDECRFCQSTGVLPLRTKDQKSRDRCLARRDRADRRAAQEQKHRCWHAPREWIDAGRLCPDAPARCDGIPY